MSLNQASRNCGCIFNRWDRFSESPAPDVRDEVRVAPSSGESGRSRADVNTFFKKDVGPCGWGIDFPIGDLAPGNHQVRVAVSQALAQPPKVMGRLETMHVYE
jgi:hypothetical protein